MNTYKKSRIQERFALTLTLALSTWALQPAEAETLQWIGVPGTTATTNWSDHSNWNGTTHTPVNNQAQFAGFGGDVPPSTAINNVVDVSPSSPYVWELDYIATNLNYTTLIPPGVTLTTGDGNGKLYVGCDQTVNGGVSNAVETVTITGVGGTLLVGGNLRVGQGYANFSSLHNVILDLSGLDNYQMFPNVSGTRLLVCGQSRNRAQGTVYLAKTNSIILGNDLEIGAMSTFSNTVPVGLYLGQTNLIFTGYSGVSSDTFTVGSRGCTNGFMKFNPAFLGGANPPACVYIGSPTNINGGRVNNFYVGYAVGGVIPATGSCDLSGGYASLMASSMFLGVGAATPGVSGTGILTFDNGIIDVNTLSVGAQATSAGGAGIGILNMSTNCTLKVNTSLILAAYTGTAVAGDAGTLNMNGGTLIANTITNGAGVGTINMTNATWQVAITPGLTAYGNATVANLNTGGTTNFVSVSFASLPSTYPVTTRLVKYQTLGGVGITNIGLNLPPGFGYAGYLTNNTTAGAIDVVLTAGAAPSNLAWTGADPSGNWDVANTVNWTNATGAATVYNQLDLVRFDDTASGTTSVSLVGTLTPSGLRVTNNSKTYTFGGAGSLSGAGVAGGAIPGGLVKQGSGTLILANTTPDTYLGGVNISAGVLQIGDGVNFGSGSLGAAANAVVNSGGLVVNRPGGDTFTLANVVSGAGGITNAGAGTLLLNNANTFTGPVAVAAGSTLQLGNSSALGTTAGGTFVAAGATLDLNGFNPGAEPITVQGTGADGSGAIINNNNASTPHLAAVTLAGDTLFGGSQRWDLTNTLSASSPYNVTMANATYCEWRDVNASTAVNNLNVNSGTLGWVGSTTAGTGGALTVASGAALKFYNSTANANVTKPVVLADGSTVANGGGANTISAPISLTGFDTFDIGGTSLTLSGALSGTGTIYKQAVTSANDTSPLVLSGNSPAFNGAVSLYAGKIVINGILGGSSTLTSQASTAVAGNGTNNGLVDISGGLLPGDAGVVGTFTANGGLTLEASAMVTNDLSTLANGANDLVRVIGDLTVNGNTLYINPIGGPLQSGKPYTLFTYTGSLIGSFAGVQTTTATLYTLVLTNDTSLSPKQIQVVVTGGSPSVLIWNNASGDGEWNVQGSANWSNVTSHVSADMFFSLNSVTLDDSITSSAFPNTTLDIASGVVVGPSAITNNSTTNYTISGAGKISNGANLVKLGTSTLTLSNANDFTGPTTILGGTVRAQTPTALGATNGTVTITNAATLDVAYALGTKPIVVSGAGVGGNGAIVNNDNSTPLYDSSGGLTTLLTLAGDTTFGGSNRWDLGGPSGATLSTGGKSNNVTVVGPGTYKEWQSLTIDPALANINIQGTELGVKGMTNLGNPAGTVTIFSGGQLTFWGGSNYTKNCYVKSNGTLLVRLDGPVFNLNVTLEGGATFGSINNAKTFTGPINLLGLAHFLSGNALTTFSNVVSGVGGFYWDSYDNELAFAATNTYSGPTLIGNGLTLALLGNGSILNSSLISFGGTDTNGLRVDLSGKADNTLTLASGQTLIGAGRVNGALVVSPGATLSPGTNITLSALGASGNITLNGTTTLKLNGSGVNDVVQSGATINYGGTLNLLFLPNTLGAGNSWKLFNATGYSGAFAISPASPGTGLSWDASQLATTGTLRVVAQTPPHVTAITLGGGKIVLRGTNGPANGFYAVLSSTNVAQHLNQWLPLTTNQFDGNGNFNWTNAVNPAEPVRFYLLRLQ